MAESVSSERVDSESEANQPLDKLAGIGSFAGIAAALVGLISLAIAGIVPAGLALEIPSFGLQLAQNPAGITVSGVFIILLAAGLLLQFRGARTIGFLIESNKGLITIMTGVVALAVAIAVFTGLPLLSEGLATETATAIESYRGLLAISGSVFIIMWQFNSVMYIDSSKSYWGMAAGLLNGLFLPVLALNAAVGYALLFFGQMMTFRFWTYPRSQIREFARSTDTAKFGFGVTGFVTVLLGGIAAFGGALQSVGGIPVWLPWSAATVVGIHAVYATPPYLVGAILSSMLFWSLLGPRLGAKELRESQISEDIVKGAWKYMMIFMAIIGVIGAGQCSTGLAAVSRGSIFLTLCPAAILFLMGLAYTRSTDVVTGLPLVLTSIYALVGPHVLSGVIIFTWALAIITQGILMLETWFRKFTHFSQKFLTVIVTIGSSVLFIIFMLGGFGSGPPALWPANRWFNVALIAGIPPEIQGATLMATVLGCLIVRNVALGGFAFGRGYSGTGVIGGMTLIFALMTITISGNPGVTHQALTTVALIFGLYTVSFVLVVTLNLNLGNEIMKAGYEIEGQFVRIAAAVGLAVGIVVAIFLFSVFSRFPSASEISVGITSLVMLIVSIEITSVITWVSAGIRLKMITQGLKLKMSR
jgi:hypothetical protein